MTRRIVLPLNNAVLIEVPLELADVVEEILRTEMPSPSAPLRDVSLRRFVGPLARTNWSLRHAIFDVGKIARTVNRSCAHALRAIVKSQNDAPIRGEMGCNVAPAGVKTASTGPNSAPNRVHGALCDADLAHNAAKNNSSGWCESLKNQCGISDLDKQNLR